MKTLNLYGPMNQLGYGIHFTGWAGHLLPLLKTRSVKVSVNLTDRAPFPEGATLAPHVANLLQVAGDPFAFDPTAPSICLASLNDVSRFTGSVRILYTVFETTRLNALQLANTKKVDWVIVPTAWHASRLLEQDVRNIRVIPEGVDKNVFHLGDIGRRTEYSRAEDHEELLTLVSVGKLEKRKGMEVMLDAIRGARDSIQRPMRILAHWFNPFIRHVQTGESLWYRTVSKLLGSRGFAPAESDVEIVSKGERVVRFSHREIPNLFVDLIVGPLPTQDDLVQVYRAGDFGIFPHYAEGWGLPLHESMACGLPPITQKYSGPEAYLEDGCFLGVEGSPTLAKDGNPREGMPSFFHGDVGTWQQVSTSSLTLAIIRAAGMTKEEKVAMGRLASKAALKFTWQHSAETTIEVLKGIDVL